jgi:hypothetical protein
MKYTLIFFVTIFQFLALSAQVDLEVLALDANTAKGIEGLKVRLENEQIGFQAELPTNFQGKVRFSGLKVADGYVVRTSETETYQQISETGISLRTNQHPSITLLVPNKLSLDLEEVEIKAFSISRINTVNAEVASELTRKEITTLPIEGRDITRALYRLPNVTQATGFYPEAPNVAINGANSLFTNYMIDGMDNNERFLGGQKFSIPVGFTQNITVLTNNYSTEFGLTGNGIINLTSRSGSNELSGEAFYLTRPGPVIDASSPYAQRDLSGNQVKDGFMRQQAGFGVGGALKKDKTFFYLNAEQTLDFKDNLLNVPQLGVNETVSGMNRFTYLSGKIDQLWSDRFRSSLRVNAGLINIERQGGGLEGGVTFPSAGNSQDRNSLLIASKNMYLGENFSSETNLQYSRFRWNYGRPTNGPGPQVTVLDPQEQTLAVLGHPGFIFDETENTLQFQQKFNFYLGQHRLKVGAEVISADHSLFGGGNVNGNYLVKLTENQLASLQGQNLGSALGANDLPSNVEVLGYNVELQPTSFGTRQNIFSLYVEDLISLSSRFNLTLGLRYDYDNLSKGGAEQGDFNNLAPRTSFNYKLGKRSSLRGGVGLFYEKIVYAIYSDALQQSNTSADFRQQLQFLINEGILPADTDLDRVTFDGNLGATAEGVAYLQGPSPAALAEQRQSIFSNERRILNPEGYDNPYTWQFSLGFQHQLDDSKLFYVDVMHNRSYNLFRLRDLNAPAAYPIDPENVVVRSQEVADFSRPVAIVNGQGIIGNDTLTGVSRRVTVTETAGSSQYYALSLNLVKEPNEDNFGYRLNYTLSSLKNDTEDINFTAMDANDFEAEWGPSINDRTHVLNGLFYYFPVENLSVSVAALLQSGQPINRIPDATIYGTTDLNGDGRSFGNAYVGNSDRQPGETRNNDRLPWSNTFDLGVQYNLKTGEKGMLELRADVFNLFNAVNLSGYSNNATQSNQIQVGTVASGLLVRRNAAPPGSFSLG